jgi:hypothetical protein
MNCFAIYTYFHVGLALVAFQYIFFLLNTLYGFVMWRKSKAVTDVPEQPAVQVVLA